MEISKELAKELLGTLTSTKDFILDQAPDVVRQLLLWELWSSIFFGSIFLLVLIFSAILIYKMHYVANETGVSYSKQESAFTFMLVGGASLLTGVVGACFQSYDIIKVLVAPKIFLIEYLTNLLK